MRFEATNLNISIILHVYLSCDPFLTESINKKELFCDTAKPGNAAILLL